MALNISLIGDELNSHAKQLLAALHAYVHGPVPAAAPTPVAAPVDSTPPVDNSAAEAAAASAEAAATSKKAKKAADKKAADAEAASTKEAQVAIDAEADAAPARDYAVEELRALAGELNVDATRAKTIEVLTGVGAKSVTALKDMTAEVRCDVFDKLTAILDEAKSAAAALN